MDIRALFFNLELQRCALQPGFRKAKTPVIPRHTLSIMSNISGGGLTTPPGWYDDGQGNKRWWDGSGWTEQLESNPSSANSTAQPLDTQRPDNPRAEAKAAQAYARASRPWFKKKRWWTVAAIVIVFMAASLGGRGGDDTTATATDQTQTDTESKAQSPSDSASESESVEQVEEAVPTEKAEPTKKAEPTETVSQENARASAADYLAYTAFSRSGLIDQLKYEGFSIPDATYGVDSLLASWSKQAAKSAQDYLDYTSFSRAGLIEQLEYEGYTTAQAVYGVDASGL